jgi:uncharacterized protein
VYFVIFGYAPLRIADFLIPNSQPSSWILAIILVAPAAAWLSYRPWHNSITRTALRGAYLWLGVCFVALMILLPFEVIAWLADLRPPVAGQIALCAVALTCTLALANAFRFRIREVDIRSDKLTQELRLVHISDVHIGSRHPGFLARVVDKVREMRPDLVAITGDLVDFEGVSGDDLSPLAKIDVPVYFCIGNHERYVDCDAICARLEAHGVIVLRNACALEGTITFVGIDDAEGKTQVSQQLPNIERPSEPFTVLLYHRPDDFEAAAQSGIDLMLCGHTHNGQIVPFNFAVKRVFPRIAGLYEHAGAKLYVSPGTGTWGPPLRLGSVNEITLLKLGPAPV